MLAAGLNSEGMHQGQLVPCCGATCIFNLSGLLGSIQNMLRIAEWAVAQGVLPVQ